MSGFHDEYPSYELMAQHDEATGKVVRKELWKVFWIMLIVTLIELFVGFYANDWGLSKLFLKFFFIGLTIVKAGYIVWSFMHLGHETKPLKFAILVPFTVFILYLILLLDVLEGNYSKTNRYPMDPNIVEQTGSSHGEHH
jgi:cytochrome c oxidase subunit IV